MANGQSNILADLLNPERVRQAGKLTPKQQETTRTSIQDLINSDPILKSNVRKIQQQEDNFIEEAAQQGASSEDLLASAVQRSLQRQGAAPGAEDPQSAVREGEFAGADQELANERSFTELQQRAQELIRNPQGRGLLGNLLGTLGLGKTQQDVALELDNIARAQGVLGETPLQQRDINSKVLSEQLSLAKDDAKSGRLTASNLLNKFEPIANSFQGIIDSFARVEASAEDPSAAGDLALIFNFMKILDPNSVVRESEFATAQNAAGVPDRIRAMWNGVRQGDKLAPRTRKDITTRARKLFNSKKRQFTRSEKEFRKLAVNNNIDPDRVLRKVEFVESGGTPDLQKQIPNMSDEDLRAIISGGR